MNSKTHVSLTSCFFLIAHGCVLKGLLWGDKPPVVATDAFIPSRRFGAWARRGQGFPYSSSLVNINCRKLAMNFSQID